MGAGCLSSRDQSQFASVPDLSHYDPMGYLVLDSGEREFRLSAAPEYGSGLIVRRCPSLKEGWVTPRSRRYETLDAVE